MYPHSFSGDTMKNVSILSICVLIFATLLGNQEVNGLFFDAPESNCDSYHQCKYRVCRKVTNSNCLAMGELEDGCNF